MYISEEGRIREGRGRGAGPSYQPWIKIRDLNSTGTASSFPDWKHGRMIQLLSQGELWWYLLLRWNDSVSDIREQYPLDIDITTSIARELGFRPAQNGRKRMTTDFLVTMTDGSYKAFSVKADRASVKSSRRMLELQAIESMYWKQYDIPWKILYKEDLNAMEVRNIRDVVSYYSKDEVHDSFSLIRHLIAHKLITVDMTQEIDYTAILHSLDGGKVWNQYRYLLDRS